MQLGPHPRTRSEDQQPNRLATAAQRQNEQPRAPVLAAVRIAHHRPRAVINLALFTGFRLDDHPRFRRYCSAQLAYESLNTLIAACKPVLIDQILPDTHRVAAARQLQLDHLAIRFTGSGRTLAACSGNVTSGKKPVITSLAGFELSAPVEPKKPVITSMAGFELAEPVVTEVAAFDGALRPQPPGVRSAIPADLK